jgi:hypothetical protein
MPVRLSQRLAYLGERNWRVELKAVIASLSDTCAYFSERIDPGFQRTW